MTTRLKDRATYADLLEVPPGRVAEIVAGELYSSPRPAPRHAVATAALVGELRPPFDHGRGGPGGWRLLFEPELHFGEDVLVPDVAGWGRERMAAVPDTAAIALAPDWVCEVVSPGSERLDRAKKMPVYAREGVGYLWLVNPIARTLESYRLSGGQWMLMATHEGAARVRAEPFEVLELDLPLLWGEGS